MSRSVLKMRYRDLEALPEDGKRHEILDGEHYVSASPSLRHQDVVCNLGFAIRSFVRRRRLGKVYLAPADVWLSEHDVVVPDILFVGRQRLSRLEEKFVRGAPDLAVEVLSPSTRNLDLRLKLRAYRRFGFGEYWIVDPAEETIAVFRGEGDWTEPALRLSRSDAAQLSEPQQALALTTPQLPGLVLTLDQIFE
jgi:Uma2 family endonuclease